MEYMRVWKTFILIQSRFDTKSSSEISQKVWSLQKEFAFEQEKHFAWIFFFLKVKYVRLFTCTYIDLNYSTTE